VAASAAAWIVWHAEPLAYIEMAVIGPLHGADWWRIFTSQFAYVDGLYAFLTIATIAIFGWLLERRHGRGRACAVHRRRVGGRLLATAVYQFPVVSGGNAGALALLMAWAAPDLVPLAGAPTTKATARRRGHSRAAARDPLRAPGGELARGCHRAVIGLVVRARPAPRGPERVLARASSCGAPR